MKFYLTAAIPYVNAKPHLGHALEFIQGDVIARWHRLKKDDVFFISGADENALKNVQAAEAEGVSVQTLVDRNAQAFVALAKIYNISFDNFARSSSPEHFKSSQELWARCEAAGDIYKKKYKGLYCVGCEAFYTRDELNEKGECRLHPGTPVQAVGEENYFFKLSRYRDQLKKIIESDEYRIIPENRKHEALGFFNDKFEDFSISRSKERAHGWGVPVPGDESQYMYVWFDALNVYRSAAPEWWPANLHIIGKDIIRFHAIYWPAILLSAKLPLPKELFVHGFITVDGQKMSKTLGNVIDPVELVKKYGVDPVRYYLLREIPTDADGDFSDEKFKTRYNADLANGLGNFASRIFTIGAKLGKIPRNTDNKLIDEVEGGLISKEIEMDHEQKESFMKKYRLDLAFMAIFNGVRIGDQVLTKREPWALPEGSDKQKAIISDLLDLLDFLAQELAPFLPETAGKISACIKKDATSYQVSKPSIMLFPRL